MPRTKAVKKKPNRKLSSSTSFILDGIEAVRKSILNKMRQEHENSIRKFKTHLSKSTLPIPVTLANKTIGELLELPQNWSNNTTISTNASIVQILDATKTLTEKKKPPRSSSLTHDEGYLTAESSSGTSGDRKSRTRNRTQKTSRVSRSLSTRTRNQNTTVLNKYKTPANKIPAASYGTITPKVKPNTPQVLLRRPKQGEVALSLQGSPLLTSNVVTDNMANINIPLEDGRLLSIQPQRGLRISQIPVLDLEVKRQLETLRDNLNKVCAATARH